MLNYIVNTLNLVLIGIVVVLGVALMITLIQNQSLSNELQLDDTLRTAELIDTFKGKYSDREISEFYDSKGIPYKYSAKNGDTYVDLILEKDRIVLKAWSGDGDTLCVVSNPLPRDILDNCPLKW